MNRAVAAALVSGGFFGLGLAISGMADRSVVLAFLDVTGAFDPRLAWVLAGAVVTSAVGFRLVLRKPAPALAPQFQLQPRNPIDRRLLLGAAIFGLGWGLAGYCPGPAIVGVASGLRDALVFVPALLLGSLCYRLLERTRRADDRTAE